MKEDFYAASDQAFSDLVIESQQTLQKIDSQPNEVLERLRAFSELYRALPDHPPSAAILYRDPDSAAVEFRLLGDRLSVGRLSKSERNPAGCDLTFADAEMSRSHFEISWVDGFHILRDLNSRNGTCVNGGPPIDRGVFLKAGDTVIAGGLIFAFTGV